MIVRGYLKRRIGESVYIIHFDGREKRIVFRVATFPVEFQRLQMHHCRTTGLCEGLGCDLELSPDGKIVDIRFALDDIVDDSFQNGKAISLFAFNKAAMLRRECGCCVFASDRQILNEGRAPKFQADATYRFRIAPVNDRLQAVDITSLSPSADS